MLQPQILSFTNRLPKCALTHHRRKPVVLCYLTTTESVFNSACEIGRIVVVESGVDERRRLCAVLMRGSENK